MRKHNRNRIRIAVLDIALAIFTATALGAQQVRQRCDAADQTGWLGIDGIECSNCIMSPDRMSFSTEPRITAVAAGSPAANALRPGDVILSINGSLITTAEGGSKFAGLKPGQRVTLVIRRDGQILTRTFESIPGRCASALGAARAAEAGAAGEVRRGQNPQLRGFGGVAAAGFQAARPGFGFSISCHDCGIEVQRTPMTRETPGPVMWRFKSPPEIYNVEPNSAAWQAGIRRGDRITHIDGIEVTREEAGRRFGSVQPGQAVRFRLSRDGDMRNVTLHAELRRPTADQAEALRAARTMLLELEQKQRTERELMQRLLEERGSSELIERLQREQIDQQRALAELREAMVRAEVERQAYSSGQRLPRAADIVMARTPGTIRYSGKIGDTDVEVRGGSPVTVNETDTETIITIGDTVVRLKKR